MRGNRAVAWGARSPCLRSPLPVCHVAPTLNMQQPVKSFLRWRATRPWRPGLDALLWRNCTSASFLAAMARRQTLRLTAMAPLSLLVANSCQESVPPNPCLKPADRHALRI